MDQQTLAQQVLASLQTLPEAPSSGRYLPLERAQQIVDETIEHVRRSGTAVEYAYLQGHRRRLSITLTMIPMAESPDASCIDVGCYGYMAFWAWRHLGYSRVEGIEMHPDCADSVMHRHIKMGGEKLSLTVHNFDISKADWPLEGTYDTVLCFETLEHVGHDPSGVMFNITQRMHDRSTLVMSVPNSVSYKTLQEFMSGAPPWTYWFFSPDLKHEPRHSFEYTPFFFGMLLASAGLTVDAFRTICAYAQPETIQDLFEIGGALSIPPSLFGETMIAQARKTAEKPLERYPDCIYDSDRYYRTTAPLLHQHFLKAQSDFMARRGASAAELQAITARAEEAQAQYEASLLAQRQAEVRASEAQTRLQTALDAQRQAEAQAQSAYAAQHTAEAKAHELAGQVEEALFLCSAYQDKEDGLHRHSQFLQEQLRQLEDRVRAAEEHIRSANERAQSAEEQFVQVQDRAQRAEARAMNAEMSFDSINRSSFWRATGPARRLANRFPTAKGKVRAVLVPPARLCRTLLRKFR